jgi:hypothetical protein
MKKHQVSPQLKRQFEQAALMIQGNPITVKIRKPTSISSLKTRPIGGQSHEQN